LSGTGLDAPAGVFGVVGGGVTGTHATGLAGKVTSLAGATSAVVSGGNVASTALPPPFAIESAAVILSLGIGMSPRTSRPFTSASATTRPRSRIFRGPCSLYLIGGNGSDHAIWPLCRSTMLRRRPASPTGPAAIAGAN
jgi:hypothetical protein